VSRWEGGAISVLHLAAASRWDCSDLFFIFQLISGCSSISVSLDVDCSRLICGLQAFPQDCSVEFSKFEKPAFFHFEFQRWAEAADPVLLLDLFSVWSLVLFDYSASIVPSGPQAMSDLRGSGV